MTVHELLQSCMQEGNAPGIFFANGIGDAILALPTFRALTSLFPDKLTLVAGDSTPAFLVERLAWKDIEWISVRTTLGGKRVDSQANPRPKSLLLSVVPWSNETLTAMFGRMSVGILVSHFGEGDIQVNFSDQRHAFDSAFDFAAAVQPSLTIESYSEPLQFSRKARHFVSELKKCAGASALVAVHFETHPKKMLASETERHILERLARDWPHVQFLLVAADADNAPRVNQSNVFVLEAADLEIAMATVGAADAFIGYDSCMLHVADICRVPGIGLFTSTSSGEFGFRFEDNCAHLNLSKKGDSKAAEEISAAASCVFAAAEINFCQTMRRRNGYRSHGTQQVRI